MDLRDRLQPEMDQGFDPERGLVAYRHARHRVEPRRAVRYQQLLGRQTACQPLQTPTGRR